MRQRDCIIILVKREANEEAEEGRNRLTQRPGGLTQLAEGAIFLMSGLLRAKRLNTSVFGAKEDVGSLRERSWWATVVRTVPNRARPR